MSDPAVTTQPVDGSPQTPGRRSSARIWIIVAVVGVLAVIAVVTAVVLISDSAAIHDGPGTATFTWTPVSHTSSAQTGNPPPQPFTADINGHTVTGTATSILNQSSISSLLGTPGSSGSVPAFRYTGQFAGKSFTLVLSFRILGNNPSTGSPTDYRITVVGNFGSMPVAATVTALPSGPSTAQPAHFSGNIGHWKVTGEIPAPTGTSTQQTATVHYVVSG
jgi:hypothetical protein